MNLSAMFSYPIARSAASAAVVALLLSLGSLGSATQLAAADAPAKAPTAEKARPLPVTATFEKVTNEDGPPYVLKLKNNSKGDLKVSATVLLSVVSHNRDKAREHPAHTLAAGQTWTIPELAAHDKVILKAEGFAPLELVVKAP